MYKLVQILVTSFSRSDSMIFFNKYLKSKYKHWLYPLRHHNLICYSVYGQPEFAFHITHPVFLREKVIIENEFSNIFFSSKDDNFEVLFVRRCQQLPETMESKPSKWALRPGQLLPALQLRQVLYSTAVTLNLLKLYTGLFSSFFTFKRFVPS